MQQALLRIHGKVQGVFYRAGAKEKALSLNVKGHARNMPDGSVEVLLQGSRSAIEQFIEWAKEGPPSARVEEIHIEWSSTPSIDLKGFSTH